MTATWGPEAEQAVEQVFVKLGDACAQFRRKTATLGSSLQLAIVGTWVAARLASFGFDRRQAGKMVSTYLRTFFDAAKSGDPLAHNSAFRAALRATPG